MKQKLLPLFYVAIMLLLFTSCQLSTEHASSDVPLDVSQNEFQEYILVQCANLDINAPVIEENEEQVFYEYEKNGDASTIVFTNYNGEYKTFFPYETYVENGFGYSLIETDTGKFVSVYLLPPALYQQDVDEVYFGFPDGTGLSFFLDREYLNTISFFGTTTRIRESDDPLQTNLLQIELVSKDKDVMMSFEIKLKERND